MKLCLPIQHKYMVLYYSCRAEIFVKSLVYEIKTGQNSYPKVESTLAFPKATSLLRISVTKINFRQGWISLLFFHFFSLS